MIRNEYRRAFIMLRAAIQGYGGHVRLERRTLNGSLYFVVTAPEGAGTLRAALAGQKDGQYYATPLGALSRDRRGQLTLAWQFDPRSIGSRPLESYAWVVVADTGSGCAAALVGNIEGSRDVDFAALERAVCAAVQDAPAADLPPSGGEAQPPSVEGVPPAATAQPQFDGSAAHRRRERATPDIMTAQQSGATPDGPQAPQGNDAMPDAMSAQQSGATPDNPQTPQGYDAMPDAMSAQQSGATPDGPEARQGNDTMPDAMTAQRDGGTAASDGSMTSDIKIYTSTRRRIFNQASAKTTDAGSSSATEVPGAAATDGTASAASAIPAANGTNPASAIHLPGIGLSGSTPSASPAQTPNSPAANGTDPASAIQPQAPSRTAAQLLGLDITQPWPPTLEPLRRLFATQAPAEGAPDDGYIYIRAPMPPDSGFSHSLVGLKAEDGRVTHIRYALPARHTPQPPAGLENYRWLGGGGNGYWIYDMKL